VKVYATDSGLELLTLPGPPATAKSLVLSHDGDRLAVSFANGETWVYDGHPAGP
jgi:hypothetical protein